MCPFFMLTHQQYNERKTRTAQRKPDNSHSKCFVLHLQHASYFAFFLCPQIRSFFNNWLSCCIYWSRHTNTFAPNFSLDFGIVGGFLDWSSGKRAEILRFKNIRLKSFPIKFFFIFSDKIHIWITKCLHFHSKTQKNI